MFSVVIPLFNKASTIIFSIESILAQSFSDYEIIIINDGSNDNSVELINTRFSDNRLRIYNQENQGVSSARNRGVSESKFDYIAFLDGDDEWLPDYLKKIKESIDRFPANGMYCCAGFIQKNNKEKVIRNLKKNENKISEINVFDNPYIYLHTSSIVVVKSVFLESGEFPVDLKSNEDIACFFSISLFTNVVFCGYPLSIYKLGFSNHLSKVIHYEIPFNLVKRINYVHKKWLTTNKGNRKYVLFTKYEIRNDIFKFIKSNRFDSVLYINDNISNEIIDLFYFNEFYFFKFKKIKYFSLFYIICTKLIWKLSRFFY